MIIDYYISIISSKVEPRLLFIPNRLQEVAYMPTSHTIRIVIIHIFVQLFNIFPHNFHADQFFYIRVNRHVCHYY